MLLTNTLQDLRNFTPDEQGKNACQDILYVEEGRPDTKPAIWPLESVLQWRVCDMPVEEATPRRDLVPEGVLLSASNGRA